VSSTGTGTDAGGDLGRGGRSLPEDADRGVVNAQPEDHDSARADREMADAERAVAQGTASDEQREGVERVADARTHEQRRTQWMGG
jgi:hypothetical protein